MMSEPKPAMQEPMEEEEPKKHVYMGNNKNLGKGEVL